MSEVFQLIIQRYIFDDESKSTEQFFIKILFVEKVQEYFDYNCGYDKDDVGGKLQILQYLLLIESIILLQSLSENSVGTQIEHSEDQSAFIRCSIEIRTNLSEQLDVVDYFDSKDKMKTAIR